MQVFIIEDDDTGECRVFKNRKNAIDTMYYKCKEWDALVCLELNNAFGTDEKILNVLYSSSAADLCEVFEEYWYFRECEIEDEEG